jgi:hypothetical protein
MSELLVLQGRMGNANGLDLMLLDPQKASPVVL